MKNTRERLVENASEYEFDMRTRYHAADSPDTDYWYKEIHSHFLRVMLPQFGTAAANRAGEVFVEYWPVEILLGDRDKQVQGPETQNWYTLKYGSYGAGYLCITNRRAFVVTLAEVTRACMQTIN